MKSSILISSTESIEGMKIERYFDLVSVNVVLGTNLFSDIGASFTDLFGGASDIYQNKLEKIYKTGLDKLKRKAQQLGANGIVGIRIDFDELSGGGKSMFMLSVIGMAVKIKRTEENIVENQDLRKTVVLPEDLEEQIRKTKIIKKIKNSESPSQEDWDFLVENPMEEILDDLLKIYLFHFKDSDTAIYVTQKSLRSYFPNFLQAISEEAVSTALYSKIGENSVVISTLIKESRSFSPEKVLELIDKGDLDNAILTLQSDKRSYDRKDLTNMTTILNRLESLPNTGKIEVVKTLLGGNKEKFICENNHQNGSEVEFCTNDECSRNIKGIRKSDMERIEAFKLKVEGLKTLLD